MGFQAEADQVPQAVGVLGKLVGRPDVVDMRGLHDPPVPLGLLAAVPVAPERQLPKAPPPLVLSAVVKHGKTKTPGSTICTPCSSWALAFDALASVDIQEDLALAVPAPDRQRVGCRVGPDPEEPLLAADRTGDPSIPHREYITRWAVL